MGILELHRVSHRFPTGFALESISLQIRTGSFLGLIGPNGSGKTTLLRIMSRVITPEQGRVLLEGRPLPSYAPRELARKMAVIRAEQFFEFPFPVFEIVAMGRSPHLGRLQALRGEDRAAIEEALELTQLQEFRDRPISQLSSGERQRVVLARALAQSPSILLMDEPEAHLDISHRIAVFQLLRRLHRERAMTIVVVLHDLAAAAAFCPEAAILSRGRLIAVGPTEEVMQPDTIRAVYGKEVRVQSDPETGFTSIGYGRAPA
jgi:iron complex transport system ATP-binding protein